MKLKKLIPFCFLFFGTLALPQPSFAQEKIEVIPIIQSSKGLSGKNFNYQEGKPELRLLKSEDSSMDRNPISYAPCPNVDSCHERKIKTYKG